MKTQVLILTSMLTAIHTFSLPARAENLRMQRPAVVEFIAFWPKGVGVGAQYQLMPQLSAGATLGYAIFTVNAGLYGRWYLDEAPGSWYVEGLAIQHISLLSGA